MQAKNTFFSSFIVLCFSMSTVNSMETKLIFACEPLEIKTYNAAIPKNIECCIGADICGYNSDFGIFEVQDTIPTLLFSLHTKTKSIKDFPQVICDVMAYAQNTYNITITSACIGAPGVATENRDFACVYGLFDIDSKEIIKQSGLIRALVVNDLVVMGHGLEAVDKNNIIQVYGESRSGSSQEHGIRAIIGAKAGLGSCTQIWNELIERYITHPGEGGIVEFAPNNQFEFDMAEHLKQMRNSSIVYWDAFVSGCGIERIYNILKLSNKYHDSLLIDVPEPSVIFANPDDKLCEATINLFFTFYARFTRNHVFPILPYGGLYMTGKIAAKNVELFPTLFVPEYENCVSVLQNILNRIPVYVVTDDNVSLYGAARCLLLEKK